MCPQWPGHCGFLRPHVAHALSPNWPSSGVYNPPGMGLSKLSNVMEEEMRFADNPRISELESEAKDTEPIWLYTGWETFMVGGGLRRRHTTDTILDLD